MSRNGSGTYSLPVNSWNPATNSVAATASDWQALINDVAAAITQSVSSDGQTQLTGNLNMGGNRVTNIAAPTSNGDAVVQGSAASLGNLNFPGTAVRITGDFSNATVTNRAMFRTSTTNGNTSIGALSNGTATQSAFSAFNANDPTNASSAQILCNSSESRVAADRTGSGTYLPLTFYTAGSERARIDTSGNVLVTNAGGGLGYGTGAGGTVTQATSRTTAVTLNKPTGQVTLFTAAPIVGAWLSFTIINSLVTASDTVVVSVTGASNTYVATSSVGAGAILVSFMSILGSASDTPKINFAIIKGATA